MYRRVTVLLVVISATLSVSLPATASLAGLEAWDRVPAGSPGTSARLLDVAAVGGAVWAVGNTRPEPLVLRWNGTSFTRVALAGLPDRDDVLEGIDGIAANDIWAVGHADRLDVVGSLSRAYRWNGAAWTRIPTPNGAAGTINDLRAVAVVSSDDVWAVGRFANAATSRALTLHWDGSEWRTVPNVCGAALNGVTAVSSSNVWAVGGNVLCHWNGTSWNPQQAPQVPGRLTDLQDVDGVAGALWAVGFEATSCGDGQLCPSGIVLRRTSTGWVREVEGYGLSGISVVSSTDAWAVGSWAFGPLLLHRDATSWKPVPTPNLLGIGSLEAIDARGAGFDWAVGRQLLSGNTKTLAVSAPSRYSGAVDGQTSSNATVTWIGPENGTVDADQFGHFQAGGLNAGTYTFVASLQGCIPFSKTVAVVAGTTKAITLSPQC